MATRTLTEQAIVLRPEDDVAIAKKELAAITTRGFVFMDTPGHDPVSITGLVAGGCNIICSPPAAVPSRLQAGVVDQAGHQLPHVPAHGGGHGRELRRHPGRHAVAGGGPSDF
jgi:hypothetical protein